LSLIFVNFLTSIPDYISLAVEKNSTIAYLTICLAIFLENIIPPIPSEIIMPLGGFFVYQQKLNFYILVFWGLLGTILGSLPWYYLGRLVNEKRLSNFLDKQPSWLMRGKISNKWYGVRSRPDGEPSPIMKNFEDGLIICTGFYKNGILLAPACSKWVANEIKNYLY